jgi:hypothetical protein
MALTAVIDRQVHHQSAILRRGFHPGVEFAAHLLRKRIQAPDGLQADIVLLQIGQFLLQVVAKQPPQSLNFVPRPFPVLHRKGIQR